jgi:translocation and assembly module TamB
MHRAVRAAGRVLRVIGIAIVIPIVVGAIALLILTQTRFGHERVRRLAVSGMNDITNGITRIGSVGGNLLTGLTLTDVTITDTAGHPFVSIDTLAARYSLRALLSQQIRLSDVRLVHPRIVLNKPPDGQWNWDRILFPPGGPPDTTLGFGSWITLRTVTMVDGRVIVRAPWTPPDTVAAVRDSVIRDALRGATRTRVAEVPGGYQKIMTFDSVDATLPRVRLADPHASAKLIQFATLRMIAEPFLPPPVLVRNASATILATGDSVWWRDAQVALPASRATISGVYHLASGNYRLRGHADPASLADLRWIYPRFPSRGSGAVDFAIVTHGDTSTEYRLTNTRFAIDSSTLDGDIGFSMDDTLRLFDTRVRFTRIDTRLVEQLVAGLDVPRRGTFSGRATLAGTAADMRVDADVAFDDARSGVSRVLAQGEAGVADSGFRANDLRLRFEPLRTALLATPERPLPVTGRVTGSATLRGSARGGLTVRANLALDDHGAVSRLAGTGRVVLGDTSTWADARLRVTPLALATAGRFAPALGLHGTATGTIQARGTLRDLAIHTDLLLPHGGHFGTSGTLDLASDTLAYDLTTQLRDVAPRAVLSAGPPATLTALATVRGRGIAPATMTAAIAAHVSSSAVDSVPVDSAEVRASIAQGVVTVDTVLVHTGFAVAHASGAFGLVAGASGALSYRVRVDSLSGLQRFLPPDTGEVEPRPARVARAVAEARADSARVAKATEVERAATGAPPPRLVVKPVPGLPLATMAGSLYTAGTVRGNLTNYTVRGRLALVDVLAHGNFVNSGAVEYAVVNGGTPRLAIVAGATLDSVQTGGFALDSATVHLAYQKPEGYIDLAVYQDSARDYRATSTFALQLGADEAYISRMALRFDTTHWSATRPAVITWGTHGIEVNQVDLRSDAGGRISVDGRLPKQGSADLAVDIRGLQIGNVAALLQSNVPANGVLDLTARVTGTQADPVFRGAAAIGHGAYGGVGIPDIHTTFAYANDRLTTHAELLGSGGYQLAVADGELPVDLSLAGHSGPRLPDAPLRFDLRAEDLPLDGLSHLVPTVNNVHGNVVAALSVRGTTQHPHVAGAIGLDGGAFHLVPLGVTLHNMSATLHMEGDTIVVDSLVGTSVGTVRVAGRIDIAKPSQPAFALRMEAAKATLLDNEDGRITMDADIAVRGPFDSVGVTGGARIVNAVYYLPTESASELISLSDSTIYSVIDTSRAAVRDLLPTQSPLLKNLRVNVNLSVSRDTWVRLPQANVEIYSTSPLTIALDRARQALTVEGVLNTDRGDYTFMGRRFLLARGSVTFIGNPVINPLLQLTGEREVQLAGQGEQTITVLVGGTMLNPRVSLGSDAQPPIPQEELLSYLAFGRSSSSLLQTEGSAAFSGSGTASGRLIGQLAAAATRQLAAVALGTLTDEFEASAARSLGADVFNIAPADIPDVVSVNGITGVLRGTQVELGKYLNSRTFVGIQARPTLAPPGASLQYLTPRGLQFEVSFEPRFLLRVPTLSTDQNPRVQGVFGMFLLRDWRF